MKKTAAALLCMFLVLFSGSTAFAAPVSESSGSASISVSVPESHWITIQADHSKVYFDGFSAERFSVERLSEPRLLIIPESGYRLTKVTLNGTDITSHVIGGYYTLAPVYEDKTLEIETQPLPPAGTEYHDVFGTVLDENKKPLSGVTVNIGDFSVVTDKDGDFAISNFPNGYHSITVTNADGRLIGYTDMEIAESSMQKNSNAAHFFAVASGAAIRLDLIVDGNGGIDIDASVVTESGNTSLTSPNTGADPALYIIFAVATVSAAIWIYLLVKKRDRSKTNAK